MLLYSQPGRGLMDGCFNHQPVMRSLLLVV